VRRPKPAQVRMSSYPFPVTMIELTDLIPSSLIFRTFPVPPQYSYYHTRFSRRFFSTFPSFRGRRCIVDTCAQSEMCGFNPPPRRSGSEQGLCWH